MSLRPRFRCLALMVALFAVASASCSHTSQYSPSLRGLSAQQLYDKAMSVLASAHAVTVSGSYAYDAPTPDVFDLRFVGEDGSGTIREGKAVWTAMIVRGSRYLKTNNAFWTDIGMGGYVPELADKWLYFVSGGDELPYVGGASSIVYSAIDAWVVRDTSSHQLLGGIDPVGRTAARTIDGIHCLKITSSSGSVLYVAGSDARPVEFVGGGKETGTIRFAYPSPAPSLPSAPSSGLVSGSPANDAPTS